MLAETKAVSTRLEQDTRVYLGHYNMARSTSEQRAAFLQEVRRTFETW